MMEEERSDSPTEHEEMIAEDPNNKAANKATGSNKVQTMSVDFDMMLPHIGEMGRYQIVLYLLMSIPATLPAAFLAFNQVFLSATPDHWCHVDELVSANLSLDHIKALSIPRIQLDKGQSEIVYEKCTQYDVNFTALYAENGGQWPEKADPSWAKKACQNGWDYDKSEFVDTLVTEVRSS